MTDSIQPIATSAPAHNAGDKPKERKLTPKQRRFAEAYTDITNKQTFGNATQSALEAYNTTKPEIAHVIAQETIRKPSVLNYIEELNARAGNSIEERSKVLSRITNGNMPSRVVTEQRDAEGNLLSRSEVIKDLPPRDVLRAIDLSNKMEGLYNRANVAEHIARREYDERLRDLRESLQQRVKAVRRSEARLVSEERSGDAV